MFHKKQKKVDIVFWVFGVIVLCIVISMAVLLVSLFSKMDSRSTFTEIEVDRVEEVSRHSFTPEELMIQYDDAIEALFVDVVQDTFTPVDDMLSNIEERLLDMRVPKEMQDEHLQAVLGIVHLRAQISQQDDFLNKEELISKIFDSLK